MKVVNLYIYHMDTSVFMGESLELCIKSNNSEIAATPIEFWANSYDAVVAQVKVHAKARYGTGVIKIVNARRT